MSAFGRAYHTQNAENPIFPDTKVRELMTDEEYSMIAGYILSGIDFFAPDKKDSFANNEEIRVFDSYHCIKLHAKSLEAA